MLLSFYFWLTLTRIWQDKKLIFIDDVRKKYIVQQKTPHVALLMLLRAIILSVNLLL